jgi:hypothetical protein
MQFVMVCFSLKRKSASAECPKNPVSKTKPEKPFFLLVILKGKPWCPASQPNHGTQRLAPQHLTPDNSTLSAS